MLQHSYSPEELDILSTKVTSIREELDDMDLEPGTDAFFLREGNRLGCEAAMKGNYGVGAVITHEGEIVAKGQNRLMEAGYVHAPAAHGEAEAIFDLRGGINSHLPRKELTLYAPLEPCMICTGITMNENIGSVKIGSLDAPGGMIISAFDKMPPIFRDIILASGMKIEKATVDERIEALSWEVFLATKDAIDSRLKRGG